MKVGFVFAAIMGLILVMKSEAGLPNCGAFGTNLKTSKIKDLKMELMVNGHSTGTITKIPRGGGTVKFGFSYGIGSGLTTPKTFRLVMKIAAEGAVYVFGIRIKSDYQIKCSDVGLACDVAGQTCMQITQKIDGDAYKTMCSSSGHFVMGDYGKYYPTITIPNLGKYLSSTIKDAKVRLEVQILDGSNQKAACFYQDVELSNASG